MNKSKTNQAEIDKVQAWLDERREHGLWKGRDAIVNTQAEAWLINQRIKLNSAGRPAVC